MPMIPARVVAEARKVDLLSWLQQNDPGNLVKLSGNQYCTKEHDSLKISNGKWFWFSRGIGGHSALDYLTKVKNYPFIEAVEAIMGRPGDQIPASSYSEVREGQKQDPQQDQERKLLIPDLERYPEKAKAYLMKRGISENLIDYCINHSMLFETKKYHNVLFVGYDKGGIARYGALRGTHSSYKGDVSGSNKHYSFSITVDPEVQQLHVFESAIDLLSFATLEEMAGINWQDGALLSLAGVFSGGKNPSVPVALAEYLKTHPNITTIRLHLDNDQPGRDATALIMQQLSDRYIVKDEPPNYGKDINEMLVKIQEQKRRKEVPER